MTTVYNLGGADAEPYRTRGGIEHFVDEKFEPHMRDIEEWVKALGDQEAKSGSREKWKNMLLEYLHAEPRLWGQVIERLSAAFEQQKLDFLNIFAAGSLADQVGGDIPVDTFTYRISLIMWAKDQRGDGASGPAGQRRAARLADLFAGCRPDIHQDEIQEVARELVEKGRIPDAALLFAVVLNEGKTKELSLKAGVVDEVARLQELLYEHHKCLKAGKDNPDTGFGPVEEGAFQVPFSLEDDHVCYLEDVDSVDLGLQELYNDLKEDRLLAVTVRTQDLLLNNRQKPATLIIACTKDCIQFLDLTSLRKDEPRWREAASKIKELLSDQKVIKLVPDLDVLRFCAWGLGMQDAEDWGLVMDMRLLAADILRCDVATLTWPAVVQRYLGVRLCEEETDSAWISRPLRESQLHNAAAEAWTQLPVFLALCGSGVLEKDFVYKGFQQALMQPSKGKGKGKNEGKGKADGKADGKRGRSSGLVADFTQTQNPNPLLYEGTTQSWQTAPTYGVAPMTMPPTPRRFAVVVPSEDLSPDLADLVNARVEIIRERPGGIAEVQRLSEGPDGGRPLEPGALPKLLPISALQPIGGWDFRDWVLSLKPVDPRLRPDRYWESLKRGQTSRYDQRNPLLTVLFDPITERVTPIIRQAAMNVLQKLYEALRAPQ